ncbi:hypothetical protein SMF913_13225 [Streptomyces malaysiensis]|uniref:Uncharacterized protein n=1 Tax=Streptomyces malaysiensis TaxID=92644 RepID=A0A2J7ZA89_STRMQ|nr:hypothetical protein SMF913_13225 [Streptomyces malaysiensis]
MITYEVPQFVEHHLVLMHWGEAVLDHDEVSVVGGYQ